MTETRSIRIESPPRDLQAEARLRTELGIQSLLASVLVARGFREPSDAHRYLNPSLDDLGDPKLLPDYDIAVAEILGARERGDLIFIHGDYDVDGVTSAAIFARFLRKIGCKVHVHVPHRMKEGYGVHKKTVEMAAGMGAKLFLTCDCGVAAHEQVDQARELGMHVVVTDHHHVGDLLPNAQAVVNPHREDSKYPYANLCGAGVVFRLCEGIARELGHPVEGYRRAYLDLTVMGTIADVMPLEGENRIIARYGLAVLPQTKKEGIRALLEVCDLHQQKKLSGSAIGFQLGPRLNATGRIADASRSLDLLLAQTAEEARPIAEELDAVNAERKIREKEMVEQAIAEVQEMNLDDVYAIFVGSEGWHAGIVGLVAGRLRERFNRPTYAYTISRETGLIKGSARSIPGFHLAESIHALSPLIGGGGHAAAAGFHGRIEDLDAIKAAVLRYAEERLTAEDFVPSYFVDCVPNVEELTLEAVRELRAMEPFGMANSEPTFVLHGARIHEAKAVKNAVLQMTLQPKGGASFKASAFGQDEGVYPWYKPGIEVDAIVQIGIDSYNGFERIEYRVKHAEPCP